MGKRILKGRSRLAKEVGPHGVRFLAHGLGSIGRLLPHTETNEWKEADAPPKEKSRAHFTDTTHKVIRLCVLVNGSKRMLTANVVRRSIPRPIGKIPRTLDQRELGICKLVVDRITQVLRAGTIENSAAISLQAIEASFDEEILSSHIHQHHKLSLSISEVIRAIHQISETTYENSALAFGCVISTKGKGASSGGASPDFLSALVRSKKYRALTDGYRTAYEISAKGALLHFLSLERAYRKPSGGKHYSPEWTEAMAAASTAGRVAVCLTRSGDILLFASGSMTFAYRYGQWKFWNHSHLINLLTTLVRVQKVPTKIIGNVVSAVYRAALDVAFRRTGALFLILRNQKHLAKVAREEDRIGHKKRAQFDAALDDATVVGRKLQALPRDILAEIASLDGAVVMSNKGQVLAYGAVLRPHKQGRLKGTEGSRTKAAIGASHYGLAIKVSSDGDISVYAKGEEFLRM